MAQATADFQRHPQKAPLRHDLLVRNGIIEAAELGARRETFSGTDALPMNAITKAETFLTETHAPVILAEGARLGVRRFLETAARTHAVTLFYLTTPHAAAQRASRGTGQNETWVKGASTRARNLAQQDIPGVTTIELDGSDPETLSTFKTAIAQAMEEAR